MALPTSTELLALDIAYAGLPFADLSVADTVSLDTAHAGLPFVGLALAPPNLVVTATANIITITAPSTLIDASVKRTLPLPRAEAPRESQIKHIFPYIEYQDPALIP